MNCKKWQNLIMRRLDGEINEKENQNLLAHLGSCRQCQQLNRDLEQIFSGLETEPLVFNIDPRLETSVMNAVYRLKNRPPEQNGFFRLTALGLGLVLLGILINAGLRITNYGFFDILLKIRAGLTQIAGTVTIVDIIYHIFHPLVSRELNIVTQWVSAFSKGTILVSILLLIQFIYHQRNYTADKN